MKRIIGISAFYHDSAVALIENGKIVYASQEERFSRLKHDHRFPFLALKNLFKFNKISLDDIDYVVFFEKPFLKFERLIETYLAFAPYGFKQFLISMPIWLKDKLFMKQSILKSLRFFSKDFDENRIFFSEHHLSHAASAFYPSPFKDALIFTADGVGEWATTSLSVGKLNNVEMIKEIHFPNSLGLLYSAFTYFCGFKVNSGEYKLMGLAPYGENKYSHLIKKIIDIKDDGSFRMDQSYFDYSTGFKMTSSKFNDLFKKEPRKPETKITKFYMDLAASIQNVTEEILLKILKSSKSEYNFQNLCLAGGVALNCVANGKIIESKLFKKIWIQPAAGDAGGAIGAALAFWYQNLKKKRIISNSDSMKGSYLGPKFENNEVLNELKQVGAKFKRINSNNLVKKVSKYLKNGKAVGWFSGRMEFGPRALGARSILADPRDPAMQKKLNLKIKFRESFRPFAPSILNNDLKNWFKTSQTSPYMLLVSKIVRDKLKKNKSIKKELATINEVRSLIPAVTHVDYSARIQTVHKDTNLLFFKLISEFKKLTGVPVLVNTSFNIRGEPIVCTPTDAFKCFMGTNLDVLVIENFLLIKEQQDKSKLKNYKKKFELD